MSPLPRQWATLRKRPNFCKARCQDNSAELRAEDGVLAQAGGARACRLGWKEYGNMAGETEGAEEAKAVLQEGCVGSRRI